MLRKIKPQYGYFIHEKTQYYDKALKYKPYSQAGVIINNDCVTLVSYESYILSYNEATKWLDFHPTEINYSRTTMSHVSAFLKEYLPTVSYLELKKMREDGITAFNFETGEAEF